MSTSTKANVSESNQDDMYNGLLSPQTVESLILVDFIVVYTVVCLFGIATNSINIFVYSKMRERDTVHVSFMYLSISDLFSLSFLLLVSLSYYPFWDSLAQWFSIQDIDILVFAWPQFGFRRVSNGITAYVTFERCVCIAAPLRVKSIITPRRTVTAVLVIAIAMALTIAPAYMAANYEWHYDGAWNRTVLKLVALPNSAEIDAISVGISLVLTNVTFTWVIVCTAVLVVSLHRKLKWRVTATYGDKSENISKRDKKVIRMVILLATIFIVTFTPDVFTLLTMTFDQRVSIYGQYFDLFLLLNGVGEPLLALGSSVNIFVYLKMSTSFKKAFRIYCCHQLVHTN